MVATLAFNELKQKSVRGNNAPFMTKDFSSQKSQKPMGQSIQEWIK